MRKLHALVKHYWLPLLIFNSFLLAGAAVIFVRMPKVWTSEAQLVFPENTNKLAVSLGTLGSLTSGEQVVKSDANPLAVQKTILLSDALMKRLWERDPERKKIRTLAAYKQLFTIKSAKDSTTILSIAANGSTPAIAKQRAYALLQSYQQRLNELRLDNRATRENYSQEDLRQAEARLKQAQVNLAEFKARTGLVNNEEQTKGIVSTMNTLTTSLAQASAQAQSSDRRIQVLSERLRLSPDQAIRSLGLGENKDYQYLRQRLVELEANLVSVRSRFTDESPNVKKLLEQRQELLQRIQSYVEQASGGQRIDTNTVSTDQSGQGRAVLMQQLVLAEAESNAQRQTARVLQNYFDQLNGVLKSIPGNQEKLMDLQRQVEIAEGIYKGLVTQVKQTRVDSFNSYPNVQVLDPPTVGDRPTSPKLSAIGIGTLLAAVLGSVAIVLMLEARNPLLRPKDLQRLKFPLVIRVPQLRVGNDLIGLYDGTELEFQRLASAVSLQPAGNRRLLITSAMIDEGKTTIALKLAIALNELGFRVLVVDADYRHAVLSARLGFLGTTDATSEPIPLKSGLDLLPTQPKQGNLMEFVSQGNFQRTLLALESTGRYDYILVDSSPLELAGEGILMASIVQQVLFVVRPGKSERKPVMDSLEQLKQHGVKLLGLVINDLESKSRAYAEHQPNDLLTKKS